MMPTMRAIARCPFCNTPASTHDAAECEHLTGWTEERHKADLAAVAEQWVPIRRWLQPPGGGNQ